MGSEYLELEEDLTPNSVKEVLFDNLRIIIEKKPGINLLVEIKEISEADSKLWQSIAQICAKAKISPHMLFDAAFRFYYGLPPSDISS